MTLRSDELLSLLTSPETTLRGAMHVLDQGGRGIVLVVDGGRALLGTLTDGDFRRAVLVGADMDAPVSALIAQKEGSERACPVTGTPKMSPDQLRDVMLDKALRHIPILDSEGRVIGLVMLDDLLPRPDLPVRAVLMAGGLGTRLRPLTEDMPKPMLHVGDKPLIQHTIEQLQVAGVRHMTVTTHHKPEKIHEHFGDGSGFGVDLDYVNEDHPLGTAGSLSLITDWEKPLLVMNGDVLTRVDFRAMLEYHQEHEAELTVAVRQYGLKVPYGVVECEGPRICSLREKPELKFLVNAGIYLVEPSVRRRLSPGERLDMTELIERLLNEERTVVSFPIIEYWLDIGQPEDYERAQRDAQATEGTP